MTPASCLTGQPLRNKPLIKDTQIVYHLNGSAASRHYNFPLQLAGDDFFYCIKVDLVSHSHEIKFGIGDSEFKSDMPVEQQRFSGMISRRR